MRFCSYINKLHHPKLMGRHNGQAMYTHTNNTQHHMWVYIQQCKGGHSDKISSIYYSMAQKFIIYMYIIPHPTYRNRLLFYSLCNVNVTCNWLQAYKLPNRETCRILVTNLLATTIQWSTCMHHFLNLFTAVYIVCVQGYVYVQRHAVLHGPLTFPPSTLFLFKKVWW